MPPWVVFWRVLRCRGSVSSKSTTETYPANSLSWQSALEEHRQISPGLFFALAATVVLGTGLRLFQLDARPATPGELDTAAAVAGGLNSIWRSAAQHRAPLAQTLFWLGAQAGEVSLLHLRLVSVIAAAMMLPLLWLAAAHAVGRGTALLATALLTSAPVAVRLSQQAVPAALAVAALPLTFLCYEQLRRRGSALHWALFALAGVFVTLCTYACAALVLAQLVALLIVVERRRRVEVLLGSVTCALLLMLAVSPLLGFLLRGGILNSAMGLAQLTSLLAMALAVADSPLRGLALLAVAGAAGFALLRSWHYRSLLPHLLQIAALVLVLLVSTSFFNSVGEAATLVLPSLLLIIASGLSSLAELRFGWLLAALLAALLLTNHFVGLVAYFVAV